MTRGIKLYIIPPVYFISIKVWDSHPRRANPSEQAESTKKVNKRGVAEGMTNQFWI